MNRSARPAAALLVILLAMGGAEAADPPPADPAATPSFEEVQAMIARMQQRLDQLGLGHGRAR